MANNMNDVFDQETKAYKKLRKALLEDRQLSEQEKNWLLKHILKSIDHHQLMIELELY